MPKLIAALLACTCLTGAAWADGNPSISGANISTTATGASNPRLDPDRAADAPSLLDFIPIGTPYPGFLADATSTFQNAANAVCARGGGRIRLPPMTLTLAGRTSITYGCEIQWDGGGAAEIPSQGGTWLHITGNTASPFVLTGTAARGSTFRDFGVYQDQPAPATGWTPAVYPPVFDFENMAGQVNLIDLRAAPVYQLARSYNSGRFNLQGFRGQVLKNLVAIDASYDIPRIVDVHNWPFWSSNANVLAWTQGNVNLLDFGRVDTPILDKIFTLGTHALLYTHTTASGDTTAVQAGLLSCDGSYYCLDIEGYAFTGQIANLRSQNEIQPQGNGIPVAGGRAVYVPGNYARFAIGMLETERNDTAAIQLSGTGIDFLVGQAYLRFFNQNRNGSGAVQSSGAGSIARFSVMPTMTDSYDGTLGAATVPMQENTVLNQANVPVAFGSAAGGPAVIAATGSDPSINMVVDAKGNGRSCLTVGGTQSVCGDNPSAAGNTDMLVRSLPGALSLIVESASTQAGLTLTTKGGAPVSFPEPVQVRSLASMGSAPVSCAPGTVNIATLSFVNGILAHC